MCKIQTCFSQSSDWNPPLLAILIPSYMFHRKNKGNHLYYLVLHKGHPQRHNTLVCVCVCVCLSKLCELQMLSAELKPAVEHHPLVPLLPEIAPFVIFLHRYAFAALHLPLPLPLPSPIHFLPPPLALFPNPPPSLVSLSGWLMTRCCSGKTLRKHRGERAINGTLDRHTITHIHTQMHAHINTNTYICTQ